MGTVPVQQTRIAVFIYLKLGLLFFFFFFIRRLAMICTCSCSVYLAKISGLQLHKMVSINSIETGKHAGVALSFRDLRQLTRNITYFASDTKNASPTTYTLELEHKAKLMEFTIYKVSRRK